MVMHTVAVDTGRLGQIDLVDVGSRSGLLWRGADVTVVGFGALDRTRLTLDVDRATVHAKLRRRCAGFDGPPGTGSVAFSALPFRREQPGTAIIPEFALVDTSEGRFLTCPVEATPADADVIVGGLLEERIESMPTEIAVELGRSASSWRDEVVTPVRDHLSVSPMRKAVLARELTLRAATPFPVARVITDLVGRFPTANVFCMDGFVGASPEMLVSRSRRVVRAHPLAGTASRGADASSDAAVVEKLRASSKDRVEHRITIDWLLSELLPFCSYVDAEPEPSVVSLANVHHLGTLVEGVLSEPAAPILDLVNAVHPTPAVGGDPQDEALVMIGEREGFDRGRYAGPVGWFDARGNGEFAVGVRTAQIEGATATICAGVGVVEQSDPEAELVETQAKFAAMLGTLLSARL